MNKKVQAKNFTNADQEIVEYDGSDLSWRVSVYAVICEESKVFIIKNRTEKLFDIVGGGIDFGETIEEALEREAMEEAGAKIKIGKLVHAHVDWFYYKLGTFHQTLQLFYQAELVGDLQEPTEPEMEWRGFVKINQIGKKYRLPPIVEEVISTLS